MVVVERQEKQRVVIVGAGNVAWHLAPALEQAGHQVVAVASRHLETAKALVERLQQAVPGTSLDFSQTAADVVVLAVADGVLEEVVREARFPQHSLVVHTSGTQPLAVLEAAGSMGRTGVLYPLQTFSKAKQVEFQAVPFCVEGVDASSQRQVEELARSLSEQVLVVSSEERRELHLAAVFACNFTNHLLGIGFELLKGMSVPAHLLHPLVRETVAKALAFPPFTVQTGPAARGDEATMAEHLRLLTSHSGYQQLYRLLSESIHQHSEGRGEAGNADRGESDEVG